jgi:DNA-directed RNA polymerase II subunit RPB2
MIYDQNDTDMIDMLRASLEEAAIIRTREDALDYIAKRGGQDSKPRNDRIRWATILLEEDFLPHVSTSQDGHLRKGYFVGYMVNRMLTAALGRATEDDRDYYGKKRLEMAGTLLAGLFRQLFRQFIDDMVKTIQKDMYNRRQQLNLNQAMRSENITRGIKSALSTGNWGKDRHGNV